MDELMNMTPENIGWLIWLVWALVGVFEALAAQRYMGGRRVLLFDLVIGVVAAVLGGYLSTQTLGDTPVQLFLISVLGAIFFGAAALMLTGLLMRHFRNDQ